MKNGLMTIPCKNDFAPPRNCRIHHGQIPTGASAGQVPRSPASIKLSRALHGLLQNPVRMVKIIRPFHLRNIEVIRKSGSRRKVPLVPRHVHRIRSIRAVALQLILKNMI